MSVTEQPPVNASTLNPVGRAARAAEAWLRRDWLVIVLLALGTAVMTYPLILRLDGDRPLESNDALVKVWDIWWFGHMLRTGQPAHYTQDMFYPVGLNLTYHSISWTVSALGWLLTPVFGYPGAYKITVLMAAFATAYAGYLLIHSLVKNRAAACLGGAIYSFAPYHIARTSGHPDLAHLAPIPLTVLLLIEALSSESVLVALGAALMLGVTAFTSLYILGFALLTLPLIFVYLALDQSRWKGARFWRTAAAFTAASALALTVRLWPMLREPGALTHAIEEYYKGSQADLLAYVIPPSSNPILKPILKPLASDLVQSKGPPPYLGLIPITLTLSALTRGEHRWLVRTWFAIGLCFGVLSLGAFLRFNGHSYENITLPAAYLTCLPFVKAIKPHYFHTGLLLPLGVCSAYGLDRWLIALRQHSRMRSGLVAALAILLMLEYWSSPFSVERLPVSPFYAQIASEEDEFALIDLPMGRPPSKWYMYLQSIHNRPIVEGIAGRTPAGAYRYIEGNPVLAVWRKAGPLPCDPDEYEEALDALLDDGFRYVIVHWRDYVLVHWQTSDSERLEPYFQAEPVYQDSELAAYRLEDLKAASLPESVPCR